MLLPPDAPTFDVVRVAPDAPPVLAGRAVPGSRLIVLDNGEVIGTATADGNGEWALVTDAPLAAGRHELTLALATPEGAVVVEQADTQAGPPQVEGDGLPTPPLKPEPGSAPTQIYMVQLASVPSASDAEREWTRLQRAHPTELGTAPIDIGAVEIGERGTFYRLRTGPFADRAAARQLCGALNAAGQECLVVRQATGE
jgi:cell division septation protein DedD